MPIYFLTYFEPRHLKLNSFHEGKALHIFTAHVIFWQTSTEGSLTPAYLAHINEPCTRLNPWKPNLTMSSSTLLTVIEMKTTMLSRCQHEYILSACLCACDADRLPAWHFTALQALHINSWQACGSFVERLRKRENVGEEDSRMA